MQYEVRVGGVQGKVIIEVIELVVIIFKNQQYSYPQEFEWFPDTS